jgi:hypothetical protein
VHEDRDFDDTTPLFEAQLHDGWNCAPKRRLFLAEFAKPATCRTKDRKKAKRRKVTR